MVDPIEREHDAATGLWAVQITLVGGRNVTVVLDPGECDRFTELAGGYGTRQLPASETVMRALLYAATGRDVLAGLSP